MALITAFVLLVMSGCGGDPNPKALVDDAIKSNNVETLVTMYKTQKDDNAKKNFSSEIVKAYSERIQKDMSTVKSFKNYSVDKSITSFLDKVGDADKSFGLLRNVHGDLAKLADVDKRIEIANAKMERASKALSGVQLDKIRKDNFYIVSKVQDTGKRHLFVSTEAQTIGDSSIGFYSIPTNQWKAIIEVDSPDFFRNGSGQYWLDVVPSGTYEVKDAQGFEYKLPLYKIVSPAIRGAALEYNNSKSEKDYLQGQRNTLTQEKIPAVLNGKSNAAYPAINMKAIVQASESSADKEDSYVHSAKLTIDGNTATCWAEGAPELGVGESISFKFDGIYKVTALNIWIGHQKSEDLFYKNARPSVIRVVDSNGYSEVFNLQDKMGAQKCTFKKPMNTDSIKIIVEQATAGNKYKDTCIAEVNFF